MIKKFPSHLFIHTRTQFSNSVFAKFDLRDNQIKMLPHFSRDNSQFNLKNLKQKKKN